MIRPLVVTVMDKPFDVPAVKTTSSKEAYAAVLASVGATLPRRDSADGYTNIEEYINSLARVN